MVYFYLLKFLPKFVLIPCLGYLSTDSIIWDEFVIISRGHADL